MAYVFSLDPVVVIAETDQLHRQLREASFLIWSHDQQTMWGADDG